MDLRVLNDENLIVIEDHGVMENVVVIEMSVVVDDYDDSLLLLMKDKYLSR